MERNELENWMTLSRVSEETGYTQAAIRMWIVKGLLPASHPASARKTRTLWLVHRDDLAAFNPVNREAEVGEWVTMDEAAQFLQATRATLSKWIREGRLGSQVGPSPNSRRQVRLVSREDVEKFDS